MERKMFCRSPLGPLVIVETDGAVTAVRLAERHPLPGIPEEASPLLLEAKKQLGEYFRRARREFDLPLRFTGTAFQRKAGETIRTIPYGETWSYRKTAEAAGYPRSWRALGNASRENAVMIIVPCHRVIAADGSLGGYGGMLSVKTALLEIENPPVVLPE